MIYWRKYLRETRGRLTEPRYTIIEGQRSLIAPAVVAFVDVLGMRQLLASASVMEVAARIVESFTESPLAMPSGIMPDTAVSDTASPEKRRRWRRNKKKTSEESGYSFLTAVGFEPVSEILWSFIADTFIVVIPIDRWEPSESRAVAEAVSVLGLAFQRVLIANADRNIWLRGAISYGPCLLYLTQGVSVMGEAVLEAAYWEKQQEWSGIMLAPSTATQVIQDDIFPLGGKSPLFVHYDIPLKTGAVRTNAPLIALEWTDRFTDDWIQKLASIDTQRPDVKLKIDNTIAFCRTMRKNSDD